MKIYKILFIAFCLLQFNLKIFSAIYNVHVFGDSHSVGCFRDFDPYFNPSYIRKYEDPVFTCKDLKNYVFIYKDLKIPFYIHWLGPKTMHGICRYELNIFNIKNYNVLENDVVVFVFGEIDVRCHIGKQRDQKKRQLEEILNTLVDNYVKTINKNRALYNNINCVIMSVVPPTNHILSYELPFYGIIEDRINITKQLNRKLQEACLLNDIKFLDIYDIYANQDGSFNLALCDQNVHVGTNQNYPIKESLVKILC